MNIGDSVTFVENGENKSGTIAWISSEYAFVKDQSGEIKKIRYEDLATV